MKNFPLSRLSIAVVIAGLAIASSIFKLRTESVVDSVVRPSSAQAQGIADSDETLMPMTVERLDRILRNSAEEFGVDIEAENNQWQLTQGDRSMVVLVNEEFDRMRIVAPIASVETLTPVQQQNMLLANFHTALDARYAVSNGLIVSAFVHPLSSLQERDLRSALSQVASLAATFGTTYSSGDLLLAPDGSSQPAPDLETDELSI
ncbi:MAG: hypothetical protein AAFQ57_06455 [Cyanobacteria bacterium J06626_14]